MPVNAEQNFAKNFKAYITRNYYRREKELAEKLGISSQQINNLKHGRRSGSESWRRRVADQLGLDYDLMIGVSPNGTKHRQETIATRHEIKTDPEAFELSWHDNKNFEIRFDDRDYRAGDELLLRETRHSGKEMAKGAPLIYTGREIKAKVSMVLRGPVYGLKKGWVILNCRDFWRIEKGL